MVMDLMYSGGGVVEGDGNRTSKLHEIMMEGSSGSNLNYSLEEMGLLLQVPSDLSPPGSSKSLEDFMLEDLNSCGEGDFLFGEEGFEEFGLRFDSHNRSASDPIDIFDNFISESGSSPVRGGVTSKGGHKAVSVSINKVSKVLVNNGRGPSLTRQILGNGLSAGSKGVGLGVNSSIFVWNGNGLSLLNRSEVTKGISFEEGCGIMVRRSYSIN